MKSFLLLTALLSTILTSCGKTDSDRLLTDPSAAITPKAKFSVCYTINNDGVREGEETRFYNQSQNEVSYSWDFGNGITSTENEPVITFTCGRFPVKLIVTGTDGRTDVCRKELMVYCRGRNPGDRDNQVHTGVTGN